MLKLCENVTASHLAWKQPWIISLSNDLFSHQTQCLLSPGCFIATIRDRWGKHKQFSWIERLNIAPAASWQVRYLHTEITSKGQALFSHINLTNWKNKLCSFRHVFKLPSLYLNNTQFTCHLVKLVNHCCYWSWCNKIDDTLSMWFGSVQRKICKMYLYFMRLHIVRCPVLFHLILWIYHYSTIQLNFP